MDDDGEQSFAAAAAAETAATASRPPPRAALAQARQRRGNAPLSVEKLAKRDERDAPLPTMTLHSILGISHA